MAIDDACKKCGGQMALFQKEGVIETFKCESCDYTYVTKVVCSDAESFVSSPDNKSIFINLNESFSGRKALFIIKKFFNGMSNFYWSDVEQEVEKGATTINLGIYSKREQEDILSRAGEYQKYIDMKDVEN